MSNRKQGQDDEEINEIKLMIGSHQRRTREESIPIGERVHKHLVRKNLRQGQLEKYCWTKFNHGSDYLKRFENVYLGHISGELVKADALQLAEGWPNPYPTEPHRSSNLLSWYRKTLLAEKRSTIAQTRFVKTGLLQTETNAWLEILTGDCRDRILGLPAASCQAGITSVPYHGEFDYGMPGQIGLEPTIGEYLRTLVTEVFRPFHKVLRDDGVLWIIIGDRMVSGKRAARQGWNNRQRPGKEADDLPAGNMARIPERLTAAMVNDRDRPGGKPLWIFRREVIINRPGTLHNNQGYQPNQTHYKCLMFIKKTKYYYDRDAVLLPTINSKSIGNHARRNGRMPAEIHDKVIGSVWDTPSEETHALRRALHEMVKLAQTAGLTVPEHVSAALATPIETDESVWRIASDPNIHNGIPSFPIELVTRLMLLSTRPGDRVIDVFGGAFTVGVVAQRLGRKCTLIEISPKFVEIGKKRIADDDPQPIPL
jgi:hypothetical protein